MTLEISKNSCYVHISCSLTQQVLHCKNSLEIPVIFFFPIENLRGYPKAICISDENLNVCNLYQTMEDMQYQGLRFYEDRGYNSFR
jgi:hypothetical protein